MDHKWARRYVGPSPVPLLRRYLNPLHAGLVYLEGTLTPNPVYIGQCVVFTTVKRDDVVFYQTERCA